MSSRSAKDEIAAAVAGGVILGAGWVTSGAPGHPALLFACGFPLGMIVGVRTLMIYDESGTSGRGFIVVMTTAIAVGVVLLGVSEVIG